MKSKFNCRHFPMKLPKNTRRRMAPKSERFFSMRLLRWNVKSSLLDVLWKRYSENFWKIHKKKPVLVIMRLQRLHCRCFHLNLAKFQVYTTSHNYTSATWLVSWKLINIFCYPCLMEDLNSLQEIFHNSIHWNHVEIFRSSHRRCFLRKDILRNFAKFTGKHLC